MLFGHVTLMSKNRIIQISNTYLTIRMYQNNNLCSYYIMFRRLVSIIDTKLTTHLNQIHLCLTLFKVLYLVFM